MPMLTSLRTTGMLLGLCALVVACGERPESGTAPEVGTSQPGARPATQARLLKAGANAIPERYIVVFEDTGARSLRASPMEMAKVSEGLVRAYGGSVRRVFSHALKAVSVTMTEAQALRMSKDPRVRYIEQERVITLVGTQIDPPWGLDRVDQRSSSLDGRYTYEFTGAGVHAYIFDTGVRSTHVEFAGRMGAGFDAIGDGRGTEDCHGHGTHVAGTVGGTTYGVAKGVTIHPVRIITCGGEGTLEQILAGIDWVTANHVKPAVANMSIGAEATQAVDDAVAASSAAGVNYVVAAGNESVDACTRTPARLPLVLTVGATDALDTRAYFSNTGGCVDIFAPGMDILSAWHLGDTESNTISGTSMATPHVAGAVALYLEGHPAATQAEVNEELIARSTRNVVGDASGSPNVLLHSACMGTGNAVKPEVTLTAPAPGGTISNTVTLSATASDDVAVTKVEFYAGTELVGTDATAPYEVAWDSNEAPNGALTLSARAFDSSCNSRASSVSVTVQNAGKAAYDPILRAPVCGIPGDRCDSLDLLVGRGLVGPEANSPNTLRNSCGDGLGGAYGFDPTLDRLKVTREDGTVMAVGKQVRVSATIFGGLDNSVERLDLYAAADANAPVWTHLVTLSSPGWGPSTLSTTYVLPAGGSLQAIRGVYRYGGSASPCSSGTVNDHDDLVFAVVSATDTSPPVATLTAPAAGATLSGNVTLSATASDDFAVSRVEFYAGDTLLGSDTTSPYSLTWNSGAVDNGGWALTARAYDASGNVGTSSPVSVTISNDRTPPTVAFTAPTAGATLKGNVTVTATASDNVRVSRVDFYDGDTKLGSDTTAPYSFIWSTRNGSNGDHLLTLKAYDAIGNEGTAQLPVGVDNDFNPPTVTLTAPSDGATLSGTVTLTADASDNVGVTKVVFYLGSTSLGTDSAAPFSFSYNTRLQANGPKVITAKAYDAVGYETSSAAMNVTFDNDFSGPTVAMTAPSDGATLSGTVTLSADASDPSGISKVVFYVGSSSVSTDSAAPYSYSYNTRLQANGPKVITAKAYDMFNNVTTSAELNVTFDNDLSGPAVAVTAPSEGATLNGTVTFSADTSDPSGISKVVFYVGSSSVGTDTTAPFSYSYNTRLQPNGAKVITAKAYDSLNNVATSAAVNVTFDNDFTGPAVAVTAPSDGAALNGTVTLSADTSDPSGISKVVFYVGSSSVGTVTSAPFNFSYNTRLQANGAKVITAKAYDTFNNVTTSAAVNVTFDNDFTAPSTALISPTGGSSVSGVYELAANATDDRGVIARVDFYLGATLLGTATTAPYTFSWDTTKVATGNYSLRTRAWDEAGNSAYSSYVSVTVTR
jgi:subtilisin family serine protease